MDFPLGFPREKRAQRILYSEAGFYMRVLSYRVTTLLPPPQPGPLFKSGNTNFSL